MRGVSYTAVFLCLLLALNEFGPAHFMRIESSVPRLSKRSNKSYFREEEDKDNKVDDEKSTSDAGKRSIGSTLFRAVKFGSEFLPKVASVGGMISTFYLLVTQCCNGKWKNTCVWTNESQSIREELDITAREIDEMQLEMDNLQTNLQSAKSAFDDVVVKMNGIGKASGKLLEKLDPQMETVLNKTTDELKLMIKEKQKIGEKVKYIDIETKYFTAMDAVLGIVVPIFTTIIPSIPKLTKWAKTRMGRYKVYELDHSVDAKAIQAPEITDAKYQSSKSWFGKQLKGITFRIDSTKFELKTKYGKAYKTFERVKEYFGLVFGYASTAYTIYSITKKFERCDNAMEEAEKGVKKMRTAKKKMNEIYSAVKEAREQLYEIRDSLKANLTDGVFLTDLKELKDNLELIKRDGIDQQFRDVLTAMGKFITEAPESQDDTEFAILMRDLYEKLYLLPQYYDCYTDKVAVIDTVLRKCKRGDQGIKILNEEAKGVLDQDWEHCEKLIGMKPVTDESLEELIEKDSAEKNYNKICELNSADRKAAVCINKCSSKEDAESTNLAKILKVPVDVVETLLKDCKVCENVIKNVCYFRKLGAPDTDLQEENYPQFTLKEIQDIVCP